MRGRQSVQERIAKRKRPASAPPWRPSTSPPGEWTLSEVKWVELVRIGFGHADAAICALALYPVDDVHPHPGSEEFEEWLIALATESRFRSQVNSDDPLTLAWARRRVIAYMEAATKAGDDHYFRLFHFAALHHVRNSETLRMSPEERELFGG